MTDTLFFADEDDETVAGLSEFVALLGVTPAGPATFLSREPGDLSSSWDIWAKGWFAPTLAPAFCRVHRLASSQSVAEIIAEDHALDQKLSETVSKRSLAAAAPFREGKSEMKANRGWQRFSDAVEGKRSPGHITTLFALQAALYHLPLASSLTAYTKLEFVLGSAGILKGKEIEKEAIFQTILPHVAVAVKEDCADGNGENGALRAL